MRVAMRSIRLPSAGSCTNLWRPRTAKPAPATRTRTEKAGNGQKKKGDELRLEYRRHRRAVGGGSFRRRNTAGKASSYPDEPWLLAGLLYLGSGIGLWLPRRLRRAPAVDLARADAATRPRFAVEACLGALRWIAAAYRHEITGLDVLTA